MNIKQLTLEDIVSITESLCHDYGDFLTEDCMDEIVEKIFDQYDSCNEHYGLNSILHGLNSTDASLYTSIIESVVKIKIQDLMLESENSLSL
jgi:metal-dependent HD superfamily phosphatase/phosphodiesterase